MFFRSLVKVFLLVGALLWTSPVFANTILLGEQLINNGFQSSSVTATLNGWSIDPASTLGVNARLNTNTINTSGGNVGFNNFFYSPFAVLGDNSGQIGSTPDQGTFKISQSFLLPSLLGNSTALNYDLEISFSTVFDGSDYNGPGTIAPLPDVFSAYLSGNGNQFPLFSQDSLNFPGSLSTSSANNQLINNANVFFLSGLDPGSYTLTFSLFEQNGTGTGTGTTARFTNTAAGIDNVSVMATANIAVVPEPATFLLLGGGLALLALFGRRNSRR